MRTQADKEILKQVDHPLTEFHTDGYTQTQAVHVRFSHGFENIKEARKQVFSGSHWALYNVPRAIYEGTNHLTISWLVDAEMDNTFEYEVVDQISDKLVLEELSVQGGQLDTLLEAVQALQDTINGDAIDGGETH